jgi:excisionase family DNA binding protein
LICEWGFIYFILSKSIFIYLLGSLLVLFKRARITMPTLDKYIQEGKIKAHRLGRRVLFSEEDIKKAIEEMPFIKYRRS